MRTNRKKNSGAKGTRELAEMLGIESSADIALMGYKATLSEMASKAIADSGLTINEIVEKSSVARSKVSAIKNGALSGMSTDLFLKVITATGAKIAFKFVS